MTVARGSGRMLANKMSKTDVLIRNHEIAKHIPPTKSFSSQHLLEMLRVHRMVVIKPMVGSGGVGVIKVEQHADNHYSFKYLSRSRTFQTFEALYRALRGTMKKKRYLIQKGIDLATVNGRPIDYRVKYVKENGRWRYTAIVGRIARSGLFVTNLQRGGRLVSGSRGIALSLGGSYVKEKKSKMRRLTVLSTKLLESRYRGINQLGYDFGIDKKGNIWMFEVNTRPQ